MTLVITNWARDCERHHHEDKIQRRSLPTTPSWTIRWRSFAEECRASVRCSSSQGIEHLSSTSGWSTVVQSSCATCSRETTVPIPTGIRGSCPEREEKDRLRICAQKKNLYGHHTPPIHTPISNSSSQMSGMSRLWSEISASGRFRQYCTFVIGKMWSESVERRPSLWDDESTHLRVSGQDSSPSHLVHARRRKLIIRGQTSCQSSFSFYFLSVFSFSLFFLPSFFFLFFFFFFFFFFSFSFSFSSSLSPFSLFLSACQKCNCAWWMCGSVFLRNNLSQTHSDKIL